MCSGPFGAFQAFYVFSVSLLTYNQTYKKNFSVSINLQSNLLKNFNIKFKITIHFNIIKLVKKKNFRIEQSRVRRQ